MKKKSTSQSAFFNLRVLIGLCVALTGVSLLALGGLATAAKPFGAGIASSSSAASSAARSQQRYYTTPSISPLIPPGFDCSKIHRLGIDKQENLRAGAIMIFCGLSEGGKAVSGEKQHFSKLVKSLTAPLAYGSTDVDLITGTETFPNVTQSETFTTANPDNLLEIGAAYNDSRGRNFNP